MVEKQDLSLAQQVAAGAPNPNWLGSNKLEQNWERLVFALALLFLALYPLVDSLWGIDLTDTGYHLYHFRHLYDSPEQLTFTGFVSNLLGNAWYSLFPSLGLWGLNLLEVLLEYLLIFCCYRILAPVLGKLESMLGFVIASIALRSYLSIFNYHQLHVFFLCLMLLASFTAMSKNKLFFSAMAGYFLGLDIAARIAAVVGLVVFTVYLLWFLQDEQLKFKRLAQHIAAYLGGLFLALCGFLGILSSTGFGQNFLNNLARLRNLAHNSSGSYGTLTLLKRFIMGNTQALMHAALYLGAVFFFMIALYFGMRNKKLKGHKLIDYVVAVLFAGISLVAFAYSYSIIPVPRWPQFSTGPAFLTGVLYLSAILLAIFTVYKQEAILRQQSLLAVLSMFLIMLTIAGSATGIKHAVLAYWIIAPLFVSNLFALWRHRGKVFLACRRHFKLSQQQFSTSLVAILLCLSLSFSAGLIVYAYQTNNFDEPKRWELTGRVEHPLVKGLATTERQAFALNQMLAVKEWSGIKEALAERDLMIYGNAMLLYDLMDMKSHITPWISLTTVGNNTISDSLNLKQFQGKPLPAFIYCRTIPSYGFAVDKYGSYIRSSAKSDPLQKKTLLLNWLQRYDYQVVYLGEYFMLALPRQSLPVDQALYPISLEQVMFIKAASVAGSTYPGR